MEEIAVTLVDFITDLGLKATLERTPGLSIRVETNLASRSTLVIGYVACYSNPILVDCISGSVCLIDLVLPNSLQMLEKAILQCRKDWPIAFDHILRGYYAGEVHAGRIASPDQRRP